MSEAETVLNWQSEKALAQNKLLTKIDQGVTQVSHALANSTAKKYLNSYQVKDLIQALQHRLNTLKFDTHGVDVQRHQHYQQAETSFIQNTIANLKATCTFPTIPQSPSLFSSFSTVVSPLYPPSGSFGQSLFSPPSSIFAPPMPPSSQISILVLGYARRNKKRNLYETRTKYLKRNPKLKAKPQQLNQIFLPQQQT